MNETGVVIEKGPQDWQIIQRDGRDRARIALSGRWSTETEHRTATVMVRLVKEDRCEAVSRSLDWRPAATAADGRWSMELPDVPAGGLYRLETGLRLDDARVEWIQRGDMVHHIGVGDVWVIAGQSNSAGYGKSPSLDGPELGVHFFHACGQWRLATHPLGDSTGSRYTPNRETANASHSPYLQFAKILKRELGVPVGLIPAALGGSPMSRWVRSAKGDLYDNMLAYFRDSGAGGCRGVLWYQGESDVARGSRELYEGRFAEFVQACRRDLGNSELVLVTVQLNRFVGIPYSDPSHDGWELMRELQRQLPKRISGAAVVSTIDLGLSDLIHNNSSANLVIGERMAAAALGMAYGRDVKHRSPDLREARREGDSRLVLAFDDVDTRLNYEAVDLSVFPFAVRDALGPVPVKSFAFGERSLAIDLARPLSGPTTLVGAPTAHPPMVVPFDICGYLPMLAFRVELP